MRIKREFYANKLKMANVDLFVDVKLKNDRDHETNEKDIETFMMNARKKFGQFLEFINDCTYQSKIYKEFKRLFERTPRRLRSLWQYFRMSIEHYRIAKWRQAHRLPPLIVETESPALFVETESARPIAHDVHDVSVIESKVVEVCGDSDDRIPELVENTAFDTSPPPRAGK